MRRNRKVLSWTLFAVVALTPALLVLTEGCQGKTASTAQAETYRCPMHPTVVSSTPGNCRICGMKLERVDHATK